GKKLFFVLFILAIGFFAGVIMLLPKTEEKTMENKPKTIIPRVAAVAGSFYPADKKELVDLIDGFLGETKPASEAGPPAGEAGKIKILIVPHAGLVYSGRTAAAGFKQIEKSDYSRVILLGASHRAFFDYAAVYDRGAWETPLGRVEIDEKLTAGLIDKEKRIVGDFSPHKDEHSLEVELIFLQKTLSNFKIAPILVSQVSDELLEALSGKIAAALDENTLLVISSDLSHYPSWEIANKVDKETIDAILSGKRATLEETIVALEKANYPGLETAACGFEAIKVALRVSELLGLQFTKIKYENSGDLPIGEKQRVVGYGAIIGWGEKTTTSDYLSEEAKKESLDLARETLEKYFEGKTFSFAPKNSRLLQPLGVFVTLRKSGELRGCIGTFEPTEPLYRVIAEMAIAAAVKDPRFSPVEKNELSELSIEISVMTPKKKISDWKKIELGKHGVVVQRGLSSGTFLPQVATETGWSLEEFLSQLCSQKAGLSPECYRDPDVSLYTFEAQVFEE
ncbi:MAG: AmmeMemoRadiSam system protein B, partial [bacterium]|nr:AmmeMemoRadiSam system protein B [bacterium]